MLDPVDDIQPRQIRLRPVRRPRRRHEAHVADLETPHPVARRHRRNAEPRHRLDEYLPDHALRRTLVRLVLQAQHGAASRVVARRPLERDHRAVERPANRVGGLPRVDLARPHQRVRRPAAHGRIQRHVVAVAQRIGGIGELLVDRDEMRTEIARQRRRGLEQRCDGVRDRRAGGQRERNAVNPRALAVGSVQPQQNVHALIIRPLRKPALAACAPCANGRPDPTMRRRNFDERASA